MNSKILTIFIFLMIFIPSHLFLSYISSKHIEDISPALRSNSYQSNVITLGDSTVRYGIDPDILSRKSGLSVVNLASPDTTLRYMYQKIKGVTLNNHSLKHVVIGLTSMNFSEINYNKPTRDLESLYLFSLKDIINTEDSVKSWVKCLFYTTMPYLEKKETLFKGYTYSTNRVTSTGKYIYKKLRKSSSIYTGDIKYNFRKLGGNNKVMKNYLQEIIRYLQRRDIEVTILRMQLSSIFTENLKREGLYVEDKWFASLGVNYIKASDLIYFEDEGFIDPIHLNSESRKKLSSIISL